LGGGVDWVLADPSLEEQKIKKLKTVVNIIEENKGTLDRYLLCITSGFNSPIDTFWGLAPLIMELQDNSIPS